MFTHHGDGLVAVSIHWQRPETKGGVSAGLGGLRGRRGSTLMSDIPFLNRCSDERDSNVLSSLSAGLSISEHVPVAELTFGSRHRGDDPHTCETEHRASVGARVVSGTSSGGAEATEAQLLSCSCRFTWGQSELSFIIIAPRWEQAQG